MLLLASAIAGVLRSSGLSLISPVEAQRTTNVLMATTHRYEDQSFIAAGPKDVDDQAHKLADGG
jgi:hypothetical protein